MISEEIQWSTIFIEKFKRLLYEKNCTGFSYKESYKFCSIPVFSARKNEKQESRFHQVGVLVTKNVFFFVSSKFP